MSSVTFPSQVAPASTRKSLITKHPLVAYFTIALTGTWLTILPLLLGKDGLGLFSYAFGAAGIFVALLSTFTGPLLAAYWVTARTMGKAGLRALFRRYLQWRVGIQWYGIALFGALLIWFVGLNLLLNGVLFTTFTADVSVIFSAYLMPFVLFLFLAFGEETGWRGFALPRLQQRYGPMRGSLILALMHGLWHIPALLVPGFISSGTLSVPFIIGWIATVMCVTFLYTWVFNNTQGSMLIAVLVHAGFNASSGLLNSLIPTHPTPTGWQAAIFNSEWNLANLIPFAIFAALIIGVTRARLSYNPTTPFQLADPALPVNHA